MIHVRKTGAFLKWLRGLRDDRAAMQIARRIDRIAAGNLGDVKAVGEGVSELRIHVGAGYRLYFLQWGDRVIILLCGGDKSSQNSDIEKAKTMAREIRDAHRDQ